MGVNVVVQTERGEHLMSLEDVIGSVPPPAPPAVWKWLVPIRLEDNFPLLRGIDAYGKTCFNRMQRPLLLAELRRLEEQGLDSIGLSQVRALRLLIGIAAAGQHRYLWFIGD